MNLIPTASPVTGNYWCTWRTQSTALATEALRRKGFNLRTRIDEAFLFGEIGTLTKYFKPVRGDLIVVLDDGWDVPIDPPNRRGTGIFGSLEVNTTRFPSLTGTPVERLTLLSKKVRELGYRGLGLWIACQMPYDDDDPREVDMEAERLHWIERAKWCHEAGVVYWKVDWGRSCRSVEYRRMMTEVVRRYAPDLMIEHALTQGAWDKPFAERLADEERTSLLGDILCCSDFLRAYDVVPEFRYTTMFSRTAEILMRYRGVDTGCRGIINIEDPVQIGAALGCSLGVMRHEIEEQREIKQTLVTPIRDAERALRWQRIAPPFGVQESSFAVSDVMVCDHWDYPDTGVRQWPYLGGKSIDQDCPAAISRGMELPQVETDGVLPLVGCSKHPNDALAVGSFPRTLDGTLNRHYPAHVTLRGAAPDAPMGIFGFYRSLTVCFDAPPRGRLMAQDAAADVAVDITDRVAIDGCRLIIPGEVITDIGLTAAKDREHETPGLVLKFIQ